MNWFFIALITPIFHGAVNHFDKYLVSKYFKTDDNSSPVGALILFSALFAVFFLPFIFLFSPDVFKVTPQDAIFLIVNGWFLVFAYIFYFYALDLDEASFVAPLFQLIPIFGFIFGYFILGETLSIPQLIGSIIIIMGSLLLSFNFIGGKIKIKKAVLLLMAGSSICYAVNGVMFKFITETAQNFWPALFWDFLGKVILGIFIFIFIKSYRQSFIYALRKNKLQALTLNSINEVFGLIGEIALVFAVLLAPVALVQLVSASQPAFVFIFGVILTILLPKITTESLTKKDLIHKLSGIIVIIIGSILINI